MRKRTNRDRAPADSAAVVTKDHDSRNGRPESSDEDRASDWLAEDFSGQLAVDVYQTEDAVVIESTIAGVRPEDFDVSVTNDVVTIKGIRRHGQSVPDDAYLFRECYWGGFSRRIILPVDVRADRVEATMRDGVLTVTLPKVERPRGKTIRVRETEDADDEE